MVCVSLLNLCNSTLLTFFYRAGVSASLSSSTMSSDNLPPNSMTGGKPKADSAAARMMKIYSRIVGRFLAFSECHLINYSKLQNVHSLQSTYPLATTSPHTVAFILPSPISKITAGHFVTSSHTLPYPLACNSPYSSLNFTTLSSPLWSCCMRPETQDHLGSHVRPWTKDCLIIDVSRWEFISNVCLSIPQSSWQRPCYPPYISLSYNPHTVSVVPFPAKIWQ